MLPQLLRLLSIYFLFCLIFATIGVNLLAGRSSVCKTEHSLGLNSDTKAREISTEQDCINYGGEWVVPRFNFDNVVNAFI